MQGTNNPTSAASSPAALSRLSIRRWAWVHKWSSLVCTLFMLLLCITRLPLIFHHEIGHLLGTEVEAPELPAGMPRADLDRVARSTTTATGT